MKKILLILLLFPVFAKGQIITTIAGGGMSGIGDGGPATAAELRPINSVFDKNGNMYVACNTDNQIRKISATGIITTVAGDSSGIPGFSGDGGPATNALLHNPCAVAVDAVGNFYFCEQNNNRVRKVSIVTGIITTIAGDSVGYSGDGGLAVDAKLNAPECICIDIRGNIYIADYENIRIRKIDTSGIITTIAGNSGGGYSGDGGAATSAKIYYPRSVCTDEIGNLYFTDGGYGFRVRKIDTAGIITTIAGNGISGFSGDGGPATAASLNPDFVACDNAGNIYTSESGGRVRMINASGIINTIAGNDVEGFSGDGGPADSAEFHYQTGMATDTCGNLYICDWGNDRIRKVAFNPNCWPENAQNVIIPTTINIYPNPTTDELTITTKNNTNSIIISNLLGQTVFTHQYNAGQVKIDVSTLPPGVYFVKVNCNEVRKFIKQ